MNILNLNKQRITDGFTLLEVMIAMVVMVIVMGAVYRLHTQTISMAIDSQFDYTAPMLAQHKLSELKIQKMDELISDSGDFGEEFNDYTWEVTVNEIESEELGSAAEDMRQVDLRIIYLEGRMNFDIRTYWLVQ